jgi:DNA-binding transcriptional regulator GbsR (MarR family)
MSAVAAEPANEPAHGPAEWQLEFVDLIAAFADVSGVAPSVLRLFGWLVVCEPPDQSVEDLRTALGLSAGAISMATSALTRMGLVERVSRPGERGRLYRLHPQAWQRVSRLRLEATSQIRVAAESALARAGVAQPRLSGMRDLYAYFERSIADLLEGHAGSIGTSPRRAADARRA